MPPGPIADLTHKARALYAEQRERMGKYAKLENWNQNPGGWATDGFLSQRHIAAIVNEMFRIKWEFMSSIDMLGCELALATAVIAARGPSVPGASLGM